MRKAIVRNSVVENIAVDPSVDWTPPAGTSAVDDPTSVAQIGGGYNGSAFTAAPAPTAKADTGVYAAFLTADVANSAVTFADATGLLFKLQPNSKYDFEFKVVFRSAALTTGIGLALTGPASPLLFAYERRIALTLTTESLLSGSGDDNTATPTGSIDAINVDRFATIRGVIETGSAGGNLQVRFKSEVAASAVTLRRGSSGRLIAGA